MFRRILYGLCVIALCISCQEEVQQELEDTIVVEGWIEAGGSPVVMLSRAFVVTTAEETGNGQSVVLPWGRVSVSDGRQSVVLTGDYDERYFPPFRYSSSKIRGVPGNTYYLTVEYGNRVLTAQTTIPMPASLEALEVSPCEHIDSVYQITANFEDDPATKDYYPALLGTIDDATLAEHNRHVVYAGMHRLTSEKNAYGPYFLDTDSVQIKFARIDETTYKIHKAYEELMILANNPLFASDVSLPTNIEGGLGFWCGYAATKYNVVIADSIR